jgi:hypothetical protein
MTCLVAQDFERKGMQAVAGKNRLCFAKGLVDRRLAAAKVGVVQARQIVMD